MTDVRGDKFMNFDLKNLKRKNHLEDLDGDGRTTLKPFKKQVDKMQRYTIFFIAVNALHVSGSLAPISMSSKLYRQHKVFVVLFLFLTAIVDELEQLTHDELLMMGGGTA
jgi:hypothetical protein